MPKNNEDAHLQNRKLKIGIVVGEVSGDTLGAKLIRRFREQGIDAEFEGIGGPQMIAEGFKSYYPMDILSVMGIVEVLKDIKKLFAVRDGLVATWTEHPVDVFIGIDAPDFNLRLSKSLKQKNMSVLLFGLGVKVVYMGLKPVLIWFCVYFHLKRFSLKNGMCPQLL